MKKVIKNLFALTLSILLCLIIFEAGLRVFGLVNRMHNRTANEYHPEIGYLHKPLVKTHYRIEGRVINYETNNLGFRDFSREIKKGEGVYRILMLGDSFLEAPHVELENVFSARLATLLQESGDFCGKKVEVLNFGRLGFGTAAQVQVYKHLGTAYKPDLILVAFYINDILDNYHPPIDGEEGKYPPVNDPHMFHWAKKGSEFLPVPAKLYPERDAWRKFLNQTFYTYQFLGDEFPDIREIFRARQKVSGKGMTTPKKPTIHDPAAAFLRDSPAEIKLGWEATAHALAELKRVAGDAEVRIVLVPAHYTLDQKSWKSYLKNAGLDPEQAEVDRFVGTLRGVALSAGYELWDPTKIFSQARERLYYETDPHFNVAGHDLMAQFLYERFQNTVVQQALCF